MGYTTEEHLAKATERIAELEGVVKDREAALSVQTERAKAYKEDNAKLRRQLAAAGEETKDAKLRVAELELERDEQVGVAEEFQRQAAKAQEWCKHKDAQVDDLLAEIETTQRKLNEVLEHNPKARAHYEDHKGETYDQWMDLVKQRQLLPVSEVDMACKD